MTDLFSELLVIFLASLAMVALCRPHAKQAWVPWLLAKMLP